MSRGPQRPTKAAPLKIPSSRLRLAQGCAPPSGGLRPVRGGALPSSRLRLARGTAPPRAGSVPLEGPPHPRLGSASLEGAPHACACPRTRAFNALDTGGTTPSCARDSRPGATAPTPQEGAHPHHCGGGTVQRGRCQSRDAGRLLRYG
jgi:hypothetical protein